MIGAGDWLANSADELSISKIHLWVEIGLKIIYSIRIVGHRKNKTMRAETNYRRYIKKSEGKRPRSKKEKCWKQGIRSIKSHVEESCRLKEELSKVG